MCWNCLAGLLRAPTWRPYYTFSYFATNNKGLVEMFVSMLISGLIGYKTSRECVPHTRASVTSSQVVGTGLSWIMLLALANARSAGCGDVGG